mgnify:CR=1 FL=1
MSWQSSNQPIRFGAMCSVKLMSNELEKFLETIFLQLKNNMIVKRNFSIFTKPTEKGHETNSDRAIASIKRAVS